MVLMPPMSERRYARRAEYAVYRMAIAINRMRATASSPVEWESAIKWATAWGMAMRTGPRCRRASMCPYRGQACTLGKANRPFFGTSAEFPDPPVGLRL